MTRYLEILAIQRPFPFNTDGNNRVMFSCNFSALAAAPVTAFENEVAKRLNTAGLGTLWNGSTGDMLIGPAAPIPTGAGPYVSILDTGGTAPIETHDAVKYERLSFQIIVRALSYTAARTRALAIWRELDGTRNVTVAA